MVDTFEEITSLTPIQNVPVGSKENHLRSNRFHVYSSTARQLWNITFKHEMKNNVKEYPSL